MDKLSLVQKVLKWSREVDGDKYVQINSLLKYLGDNLFHDYEPLLGPYPDFSYRLEKWIENVSDEEGQKILLIIAKKIFYVGREEFTSLLSTAYNSLTKRWLFDKLNVCFEDFDPVNLNEAIDSTWFCPITDSFRINQFYHINKIPSNNSFRPEWRSLKKFGDSTYIQKYINDEKIKYLVLLEDFVGSGTQALPTLEYAAINFPNLNILFIPMIICPKGTEKIKEEMNKYSNFEMLSVISLKESDLINEDIVDTSEKRILCQFIIKSFSKVKGSKKRNDIKKLKPFGFKNTGGLTVMYTNTPNNSLPVIFVQTDTWTALFERHSRD